MNTDQHQNPQNDQNTEEQNQQTTQTPASDNPLAARVLELETELNAAHQKAEEMTVAAQRSLADLQNFKRRTEEERSRFAQMASADLVRALLPHLDNFSRGFDHAPAEGEGKTWADSTKNIFDQMMKSLAERGLKQIPTVGEKLDTNRHEALLQGPGPKDEILEELEPGYLLGEFVIKAARVKVGNGDNA